MVLLLRVKVLPGNETEISMPKNIIIRNGELGRSSHQAILGNGNMNVYLENLKIRDFEVSGINMNNVTNLMICDCKVGPSNTNVPVTPLFAGLIFMFKLFNTMKQKIKVKIFVLPTKQLR